jgi:DNA-binding transcriptional regulator LsrR (DeoR family)
MLLPEGWYFDQVLRPEVERKVKSYHQQGLTGPEIARQVGCSARSVVRILKRLGVR